jgi:hypothetical protein
MNLLLAFATHWLPIFQAVGALFSVGGAVLSWRFALKAKRERELMTTNVVGATVLEKFESALVQIKKIRNESLRENGLADSSIYQLRQQEIKNIFETATSAATAASPYLKKFLTGWEAMVRSLADASMSPSPANVESATKHLMLCAEQIRISATVRQLQPVV